MIITTKQAKGGKLAVLADGVEEFVCDPTFWYSLGIYEEDEIDGQRLADIKEENERRRCCAAAYKFLSARAYSEKNVRMKLAKKFSADAIDYAVERSRELGLIDDGDLAQILAEQFLSQKHFAPGRIMAELLKRGIPREEAQSAVDELEFDAKEELAALLETKFRNAVGDEKSIRRAIASLSRMGYGYGEITAAIEKFSGTEVYFDE